MNDVEATPVYHRIKSGDTLGAIAKRYGTSVSKLCEFERYHKDYRVAFRTLITLFITIYKM